MMDYHYHITSEGETSTEYILKDVEDDHERSNKETTYDELLQEYVDLNIGIRQNTVEKEHKEYLLSVFKAARSAEGERTYSPEEIRDIALTLFLNQLCRECYARLPLLRR